MTKHDPYEHYPQNRPMPHPGNAQADDAPVSREGQTDDDMNDEWLAELRNSWSDRLDRLYADDDTHTHTKGADW